MYTKGVLDLDQCQRALKAMIAEHKKNPQNPALAMAILDDSGNLISFGRTDGARPLLVRNCVKKAYTAAMTGGHTQDFDKMLKDHEWDVTEWGDPNLFIISGGVVVRNPADGRVLGGIGVAGFPHGPGDHDMALVGLKAMKL